MNLRSKFRGSLLGLGIGDALGRSLEGGAKRNEEEIKKIPENVNILRYTDDAQQMIGLAESLIEKGGFDEECFSSRLVENFEPSRGYGPGSIKVIRAIDIGEPWDKPAQRLFGGSGSYGNGSSMRVAPVGLFAFDDLEELTEMARRSSRVTHVHELGIEGAVLQASAVGLATRNDTESDLNPEKFVSDLSSVVCESQYKEKLDIIINLLGTESGKRKVVKSLGNSVEAFNSVPTAVYSFLSHHRSFEESTAYAVSLGGDADTMGAMTGAIAGAYLGFEEIPEGWRNKLEDGEKIKRLADGLLEARK